MGDIGGDIKEMKSTKKTFEITSKNSGTGLDVRPFLFIPEPTRSLLWVTDNDPSNAVSTFGIRISLGITDEGINLNKNEYNLFSEPSLIWKRLPIEENDQLEKKPMYFPSYNALQPSQRYQYLMWLKDITQETNLSYVFLYFYGLERHLLLGDFDRAVDEIIRLIQHHDKGSFRWYATNSLIAASIFRHRPDIIENRSDDLFTVLDNLGLAMKAMQGKTLTAKEVMSLAQRVDFRKKYIKSDSKLFESRLQERIKVYEKEFGSILGSIDLKNIPNEQQICFANTSIPSEMRHLPVPNLLGNQEFQVLIKTLLEEAYLDTKEVLKSTKIKTAKIYE